MLTILLMSLIMFQTHLMEALPPDEVYQIHALSSRHPPSPRPGNPSRPPFRPQSQQSGPQKSFKRYNGPIYLPPQIYKLLSQDAMKALKAYNVEKTPVLSLLDLLLSRDPKLFLALLVSSPKDSLFTCIFHSL